MASKQRVYDVIIIGGGVAGLSAARELQRDGYDNFCVVEAQHRLGGRVKQVTGIVPWPLDAGAELVHGQDSTVASLLVNDLKADLVKKEYPNYAYWRDSGEIACGEEGAADDNTFGSTFNLMEQLADLPVEDAPADTTAAEWFRGRCGAAESKRVMPLLDAFYANDLCADLRSLGVAEAAWEARHWCDGEDTLVKGGTMAPLTAALSRGVPVRLGWPVREVRWRAQAELWSGSSGAAPADAAVEVIGTDGKVLLARAVICAVPATQLQKQALRLSPPPSDTFQRTLQATRVHNAFKIWAVFRVPFWESATPMRRAMAGAASALGEQIPPALALDGVGSTAGFVVSDTSRSSEEEARSEEGGAAPCSPGPRFKPARSLATLNLSGSIRTLRTTCSIGPSSPFGDSSSSDEAEDHVDDLDSTERPAAARVSMADEADNGPEFWHMLCPESPVPEFWVPRHAPDGLEEATGVTAVGAAERAAGGLTAAPLLSNSVHVLQGFACASHADALSALQPEAAVQAFLDQLDRIFGESDAKTAAAGDGGAQAAPGPASAAFVRGGIMDWAKEPFIEGGYSSPSLGLVAGARAELHALPGGTVFFAGEHTHERLNACLQGAMETGVRAAQQTLQSLRG